MRTTSLPHQPSRRRRALVAALAVASLAFAACGDDDTSSPPTTDPGGSDGPGTSTTTEATTTTTEPPSDEDLAREAVMGYATLHERLGNPVNPDAPHLRELLVEPILTRFLDLARNYAVTGTHYGGGYEIEILGVSVDGDVATARTCAHDQITRYRADRSVEEGPLPEPLEVDFRLERVEDGWRIAEVTTYEDEPCTLG